jgi:uncharacterized protein
MEHIQKNSFALILGASLILAATIASFTLYRIRALDNTLSVTGSTKERVVADTAKWGMQVERIVDTDADVARGFSQVAADMVQVKKFLIAQGFAETDIEVQPTITGDHYQDNGEGRQVRKILVSQSVSVTTRTVDLVAAASQKTIELAQKNIRFNAQQPQYLISNLPELRVKLIGKAIEDAKKRADSIATAMGQSVGRMKSANNGVVQVMAPDSTAVSDYGEYDTSTKEKDVMLSVKAVFVLR